MLDRTTPPPVHEMSRLTLPNDHTETLPNGLVLHCLDGGSQDVNQLSLNWQGGADEGPQPNVAKILGPMLREGAGDLTGAEISECIDYNGAILKSYADSHFSSVNISTLNSKTEAMLPVLRDMICSPTFPEAAFRTLRDIEVREHQLSQSRVLTLSLQQLAPMIKGKDHPQARIVTAEEIAAMRLDDVRRFHQRVFTADGCHAYLSGRLTDSVIDGVRDMLGSLPGPEPQLPLDIIPYHAEAPGYVEVSKPDAVQAAVNIGLPVPGRRHPDYVPLRFATIALGGYFGSRLMKNIREDKGYTYGIAAYLMGTFEGSYMLISAQCDKNYVEPLIAEVGNELVRMAEQPLDADELTRLKQNVSTSLMETLDSPFSIMDYYRTIQCVGIPPGYFERQVELVRSIDAATVAGMAAKYMQPDQMRVAVCM